MDKLGFYDPFTYNPKMEFYYLGRPIPASVSAAAAANPATATHLTSVWQFSQWLQTYFPDTWNLIQKQRPDVLDAGAVISSGALAPSGNAKKSGMGADEVISTDTQAVTEWGKVVSDFVSKYMAYDQQRKLIDLNIKRAEQGLPPISAEQYAAGVNVGLSDSAKTLGYVAVAGLVVVGLISAARR